MALGQRGDGAGDADLDADPFDLDDGDLADLDGDLDDDDDGERPGRPTRPVRPRSGPDGPDGPDGSRWARWPEAVPAWARGPAAVAALVVAAAVGGAAAGSAHRDAGDQQEALQRALTVGYAIVSSQDGRGGAVGARVHVALVNHSATAVGVQLQGLSTPHQGTAGPPEEVQVAAGAVASAPLAVRLDCPAVRSDARMQVAATSAGGGAPADSASGTTSPTVVLASVRPAAGGPAVDVQLPVVESIAAGLDQQLGWACGDTARTRLQTGWLWKDDGELRVSVTSPPGASPVRLELDSSEGLGATTDPPLPLDLGPGETAVVDLSVHPRCAEVGDGALSRLDLRAVDGGGATTSLGQAFDATTPVSGTPQWLARQVALACG